MSDEVNLISRDSGQIQTDSWSSFLLKFRFKKEVQKMYNCNKSINHRMTKGVHKQNFFKMQPDP